MSPLKPRTIRLRRQLCEQARCTHTPDFANPCASCPAGHWGPTAFACRDLDIAPGAFSEPVAPIASGLAPKPTLDLRQPGSVLAAVIHSVTGSHPSAACSCASRIRQMNQWGWMGCIRRRHTITGWLIEEARKRGHRMTGNHALALLRAAWREALRV